MDDKKAKNKRLNLETLNQQEAKILALLREERRRAVEKFPLLYALLATFGLVATVTGLNRLIEKIDFLNNNPAVLVAIGLTVLLVTGAAYKKLG